METSLHQCLKREYAADESQVEQRVGRYRIDVIRDDELIEIQHASLSSIHRKIKDLVREHRVRVVKPLVIRKQLVRCAGKGKPVVNRRLSPKRGQLLDIFDELIYFTRVYPHPNLVLEVPLIHIEEWSYPTPPSKKRRRRTSRKYVVEDQRLVEIQEVHEFRTSADLAALLPNRLPDPFDTAQLATAMSVHRWVAQKIVYCLRHMRAIENVGKQGNTLLYRLPKAGQTLVA
jgi:hypothetical protein